MVRQARSELTRRRILHSAVEVFSEIGYPAAGLGDIIDRAEMTKGALYYHFESKEALATAIIAESSANLVNVFRTISESSSPAMESVIHGTLAIADVLETDQQARVGVQLLRALAGSNKAADDTYASWLESIVEILRQAGAEEDTRPDLDSVAAAEVVLGTLLGAELLSDATSGDLRQLITHAWEMLLPSVVSEQSLDYFREFLSREALRRPPPAGEG